MEKTFTVIDTRTNDKKVWNSTATTLADLKAELSSMGISITDMSIQEGLTKTELISDNSILPHDVNYRGVVTNNLVFRITAANKKIASGLTRNAIYFTIKEQNLANEIKETFGKNFTNIATDILQEFIDQHLAQQEQPEHEQPEQQEEETPEEMFACPSLAVLEDAFNRLAGILYQKHILVDEDMDFIYHSDEEEEEPYSDEEVNEMFADMD